MKFLKNVKRSLLVFYPQPALFTPTFLSWWLQSRLIFWAYLWLRFLGFLILKGGKISQFSSSAEDKEKVIARVIYLNCIEDFDIIKFNRARIETMACLLKSIPSIQKSQKKLRLLSIGPKNEGELLMYARYGFSWKNLIGVDLFSYSPKILAMDMHDMSFPDNSFDIVTSLWSIRYSYDLKKATKEIIRVAKDKAIIAVGITWNEDPVKDAGYVSQLRSLDELLDYFSGHVDKVIWRVEEESSFNSPTNMVIVFRIKKPGQ